MAVDFEVVSSIAFLALMLLWIYKERKNIEFKYVLLIRRWTGGLRLIDKFVARHKRFLKHFGNAAIFVGLLAGFVGVALLIYFAVKMQQVFGLALPSIGGVRYPEPLISIPFWPWIITIPIIVTVHETMHAIFARMEKIPVRSYGIFFLLVLPIGAFVDPDTKRLQKLPLIKRLRILTSGSFANLLTSVLFLGILFLSAQITTFLLLPANGVMFTAVAKGSPAEDAKLSGIILSINGIDVKTPSDIDNIFQNIKPGDEITVKTTEGIFKLKTIEHPEIKGKPYMGIQNVQRALMFRSPFSGYVPTYLINAISAWNALLFWIIVLSLGVGIANLLPIKPLDGGLVYEAVLQKFFGKKAEPIMNVLTTFVLVLLIFHLFVIGVIKNFI
jgi:membrane-associated protease RseP (regulator of RpoE activity)